MWFLKRSVYLIIVILFSFQARAKLPKKFELNGELSLKQKSGDEREGRPWRLPNTSYPLKYDLHITTWIHQENRDFIGNVKIELLVKENTKELVLHAGDLELQKISLHDLTNKQNIKNVECRIIDDLLVINAINSKPFTFMQNHRFCLEIHYTGLLTSKGEGLSIMTYVNEKHKTIYGAYTDLEPYFARKVLPCYDEPALKANFTVRITHGSNYTAISNMPSISLVENGTNKMTTTSFMETPPMSTYLLAFVISNYKFTAQEDNGILQRIFFPPSSKNKATLALSNGIKVVQTFSRYMDVPYVLPKLDHIGIKELEGGMENWGLITYGENNFPYENSSWDEHADWIELQNHEIVHQWFGNLVSPEWWNSVWLNEGFATYYSHVLMKMMNPESKSMENFNLICLEDSLYDSMMSVADYVETPVDIWNTMTDTGYTKAPCIIQMFEHAFGEANFRKGASNFLKARAFSTATEDHLYDHMQVAMLDSPDTTWNYSLHEIMRPWLHAKTLPIVTITREYNNSSIIYLHQRSSISNVAELWWIPLNFATASQPNFKNIKAVYYMPPIQAVTLNLNELNITLNNADWLIVNVNSTGLYRVNYDNENLRRLANAFNTNFSVINNFNRVTILKSIPKVWTEQLAPVTTLEILKYLPQEQDPYVWIALEEVVESLQNILRLSKSYELFNDFIRNTVRSQFLRYYETPVEKLSNGMADMKNALTNLACNVDLPECIEQSKRLYAAKYENLFRGLKILHLKDYCSTAMTLNYNDFGEVLNKLKKAPCELFVDSWSLLLCTTSNIQYEQLLEASADILKDKGKESNSIKTELFSKWAELLKNTNSINWNSACRFLKKQIHELQKFPNSNYELCSNLAAQAEDIREPFHVEYIAMMELCSKQLLRSGAITESSEIMPSFSKIGANYAFEKNYIWQKELQNVHKWLKQQNSQL